ncbi:ribose 5-phosphate isomerase B [Alicyclobacillus sp. ALC3]|uniref:ribose 5-phosphate isomerase B n=1 Tax=Alicyclobacillus sp. ALC3 TaxID=2796143 RepID=UPI0027A34B9A|nr:ribose 5-phosphate isomerase B [Alicyclobacillus sp. ALC3]
MKVAVGCDHGGFHLKQTVLDTLRDLGVEFDDLGTYSDGSVDYPEFGKKVATGVAAGRYDRGILICGTGLGMCITANKVAGVRAVTAHDVFSAEMSRRHNNANVLTMGERVVGPGVARQVVEVWIKTDFEGGRHARRVDQMNALDAVRDHGDGAHGTAADAVSYLSATSSGDGGSDKPSEQALAADVAGGGGC